MFIHEGNQVCLTQQRGWMGFTIVHLNSSGLKLVSILKHRDFLK